MGRNFSVVPSISLGRGGLILMTTLKFWSLMSSNRLPDEEECLLFLYDSDSELSFWSNVP